MHTKPILFPDFADLRPSPDTAPPPPPRTIQLDPNLIPEHNQILSVPTTHQMWPFHNPELGDY